MKLLEIFQTPQTKSIKQKSVDANEMLPIRASFKKAQTKGKVDYMGGGAFADVFQHRNRPGTVMKVGVIGANNKDGYVLYLNHIFRNQRMQSNPYLPRVYDIKTYQVRPTRLEYVVEIEKLEGLQDVDAEEIRNMGERLFNDYEGQKERLRSLYPTLFTGDVEERDMFASIVARAMKQQISLSVVQDKKFREAIAIVGNIAKKEGHIVDMHSGNMMIRRTSVGPQLVITDPLV